MSIWWLAVGFIGVLMHSVGCCMIKEHPEIAGLLISIGFGLVAAMAAKAVLCYLIY